MQTAKLESTVLKLHQRTMERLNSCNKNMSVSREKILLGSNITTTLQFCQGSFRGMPTCEYYFVNQDRQLCVKVKQITLDEKDSPEKKRAEPKKPSAGLASEFSGNL